MKKTIVAIVGSVCVLGAGAFVGTKIYAENKLENYLVEFQKGMSEGNRLSWEDVSVNPLTREMAINGVKLQAGIHRKEISEAESGKGFDSFTIDVDKITLDNLKQLEGNEKIIRQAHMVFSGVEIAEVNAWLKSDLAAKDREALGTDHLVFHLESDYKYNPSSDNQIEGKVLIDLPQQASITQIFDFRGVDLAVLSKKIEEMAEQKKSDKSPLSNAEITQVAMLHFSDIKLANYEVDFRNISLIQRWKAQSEKNVSDISKEFEISHGKNHHFYGPVNEFLHKAEPSTLKLSLAPAEPLGFMQLMIAFGTGNPVEVLKLQASVK